MAGQEGEALGLIAQQHRGQVAVTDPDLAAVCDGAVDAEALQADADGAGSLLSVLHSGLQGDGRADAISPADILKTDGLDTLGDLVGVETGRLTEFTRFLHGGDAVLGQHAVDLADPAVIIFK